MREVLWLQRIQGSVSCHRFQMQTQVRDHTTDLRMTTVARGLRWHPRCKWERLIPWLCRLWLHTTPLLKSKMPRERKQEPNYFHHKAWLGCIVSQGKTKAFLFNQHTTLTVFASKSHEGCCKNQPAINFVTQSKSKASAQHTAAIVHPSKSPRVRQKNKSVIFFTLLGSLLAQDEKATPNASR